MTDKKLFELHADVCKALAHSVRIEIIDILNDKEMTFSDILLKSGITKSNLSQHLTIMLNKGLLHQRKDGLYVHYRLSSNKVFKAFKIMREVLKDRVAQNKEILKKLK